MTDSFLILSDAETGEEEQGILDWIRPRPKRKVTNLHTTIRLSQEDQTKETDAETRRTGRGGRVVNGRQKIHIWLIL